MRGETVLGLFVVAAAVMSLVVAPPRASAADWSFTLYGDAADGWGPTSDNITNPGHRLVVFLGDVVNLTLIGNDSALHNWFIDYDNDTIDDPEEPDSDDFQGVGDTVTFTFVPDRAGTWTYRCRIHPTTMTGLLVVRGTPTDGGPSGFRIDLIQAILLATIAFVLLFAAGYHLRAVRAHRRSK